MQQETLKHKEPDVFVMATDSKYELLAIETAEFLRSQFAHLTTILHVNGGKLKARIKKADRSGAHVAILIGDDEASANKVTVKPLRTKSDQILCSRQELSQVLSNILNING